MNGLEQVTELADNLSPSEQLKLVEHLAQRLRKQTLSKKKTAGSLRYLERKISGRVGIGSDIKGYSGRVEEGNGL